MARDRITGRILATTSERAGPIAAAFLTGERSGIAEEDNEAMQASSLSHLLSISGLHMMLGSKDLDDIHARLNAVCEEWAEKQKGVRLQLDLSVAAAFKGKGRNG